MPLLPYLVQKRKTAVVTKLFITDPDVGAAFKTDTCDE